MNRATTRLLALALLALSASAVTASVATAQAAPRTVSAVAYLKSHGIWPNLELQGEVNTSAGTVRRTYLGTFRTLLGASREFTLALERPKSSPYVTRAIIRSEWGFGIGGSLVEGKAVTLLALACLGLDSSRVQEFSWRMGKDMALANLKSPRATLEWTFGSYHLSYRSPLDGPAAHPASVEWVAENRAGVPPANWRCVF